MNIQLAPTRFSITQAKSLVKDLSKPNPRIYWVDFLTTILIGHGCFHLLLRSEVLLGPESGLGLSLPLLWGVRLLLFSTIAILYMRASMFIHELVHLPRKEFKGFRFVWNLLCGIPFLIPSFVYYPHVEHHRRKHYGTEHDGEYLDLSHRHPLHLVLFIAAAFVVPIAAVARFLILTPIAWASPRFRKWVTRRASSMVIDVLYLRGDFGPKANRIMSMQEVLCFLWCVVLVLRAPIRSGTLIDEFLIQGYLVSVALIMINNIRTLGAHRWTGAGQELSFEEQLLDSVNYPYRPWVTELWGPVGTRYHALHHLFPGIPYHNLPEAHRRLEEGLPVDSAYHDCTRVSLVRAIVELVGRTQSRQVDEQTRSSDDQNLSERAA